MSGFQKYSYIIWGVGGEGGEDYQLSGGKGGPTITNPLPPPTPPQPRTIMYDNAFPCMGRGGGG